jgi:hypothetical protein
MIQESGWIDWHKSDLLQPFYCNSSGLLCVPLPSLCSYCFRTYLRYSSFCSFSLRMSFLASPFSDRTASSSDHSGGVRKSKSYSEERLSASSLGKQAYRLQAWRPVANKVAALQRTRGGKFSRYNGKDMAV